MKLLCLLLFIFSSFNLQKDNYAIKIRDLTLTRSGKLLKHDEKIVDVLKKWGAPSRRFREMDEDMGFNMDVLQYGEDRLYFYDGELGAFSIQSSAIRVTHKLLQVGQAIPNGFVYEMEKGIFTAEFIDEQGYPMALIFDIRTDASKKIKQIAVYPTN